MAKKGERPETGVEMITGLPGAGKSYHAVDRLLRVVLKQRRLVYTNLPLRWRVVRKYLSVRGSDPILASYVRPLRRDHLVRFMERFDARVTYREEGRLEEFAADYGPEIEEGPDANWIPVGSVIAVDEVHRWFPVGAKDEPAALGKFISMHRHGFYWFWAITQHAMKTSLSIRRDMTKVRQCVDRSQLPFFLSLRLPIKVLGVDVYPGIEFADGKPGQFAKPLETTTMVPLVQGGAVFRCYDSETHTEGAKAMRRQLEKTRQRIEGAKKQGEQEQPNRKRTRSRFVWFKWLGFGLGVCLLVIAWSGCGGEREPVDVQAVPVTEGDKEQAKSERPKHTTTGNRKGDEKDPLILGAMGREYVVVRGRVVRVGEVFRDYRLRSVDFRAGSSTWSGVRGSLHRWSIGGEPVLVGMSSDEEGAGDAKQ